MAYENRHLGIQLHPTILFIFEIRTYFEHLVSTDASKCQIMIIIVRYYNITKFMCNRSILYNENKNIQCNRDTDENLKKKNII